MRGDNGHFRNYVPLLRRFVILVVVLATVPVVLWSITVFVRAFVAQPRIPTYRQLAAAATIPVPRSPSANLNADGGPPPISDQPKLPDAAQPKLPDAASVTVETKATPTDAADKPAMLKGSLLGDRSANGGADAPAGSLKVADTSAAVPASPKTAEMPAAALPSDAAAPNIGTLLAQQPGAPMNPPADAAPAAKPLSGRIPLPPHRPRLVAMAQMTPTNVPMPRPRPDFAGAAPSESTTPGPIDWLQNLFQQH
jgi:hypothetical protein